MRSDNKKEPGLDINKVEDIDDEKELFSILLEIMARLRSDDGCAWDREQDHRSLQRNLIEEAYETVEAIDSQDNDSLKEELGDLLLQIVFHSQIAKETDTFDIRDVLKVIISKLIRRHPHVFGEKKVSGSREVLANWEEIKKKERALKGNEENDSIFANIPRILPALHYADEIQTRASRLGFDWDDKKKVFQKIEEESNELKSALDEEESPNIQEEIGDLLFSIVNLTRHLDIDSELALRATSKKFIRRFDLMEELAKKRGQEFKYMSLYEKDLLWEEAKRIIDEKD